MADSFSLLVKKRGFSCVQEQCCPSFVSIQPIFLPNTRDIYDRRVSDDRKTLAKTWRFARPCDKGKTLVFG
jgi:hypothetical protein